MLSFHNSILLTQELPYNAGNAYDFGPPILAQMKFVVKSVVLPKSYTSNMLTKEQIAMWQVGEDIFNLKGMLGPLHILKLS